MTTDELLLDLETLGTTIEANWRPGGWAVTWMVAGQRYTAVAVTLHAALFEVRQQAIRAARKELA